MAYYNNIQPYSAYNGIQPYNSPAMPIMPQMGANLVQNTSSGLNWVQGETGAKSYIVAPNSTAVLMDSEDRRRIFLKSCDSTGMPLPLEIFYKSEMPQDERKSTVEPPKGGAGEFIRREEFNALQAKFERLEAIIEDKSEVKANGK